MYKYNITSANFQEKIAPLADKMKKKEFFYPTSVSNLLDGKKTNPVKIWMFKEVAVLGEGKSFGELALETSKPRAATIQCKADTEFAILEKKDYQMIIGNTKKRQINEKVKFFKGFRIFQTLSKNKMQRMLYYFEEKTFQRKQTLY